jgi:aspartyl-tRNA(Asn)/glutamyl-tRNA(Gln) amidotransferase subunit A
MKDALVEFRRYRGRLEATSAILYIISRAELHAAMLASHARYDLLLTPTMPVTALKVGLVVPDDGAFGDDWLNWSPYTYPFNLTQQPAAPR